MLEYILTSDGLISGVLLIRALFGSHMRQRAKYALWLLVLAKLLLPALTFETPYSMMHMVYAVSGYRDTQSLDFTNPSGRQIPDTKASGITKAPEDAAGSAEVQKGTDRQPLQSPSLPAAYSLTAKQVLCIAWVSVSLLMALFLLAANVRFMKRLHRSRREVMSGLCPLCIYESDAVSSPCLAGFLHPAIYLPDGFLQEHICMRHIIAHEYMHYRHKDHIWALLRCICVCVYWFRPLVWAAAFASASDGELACDEATVAYLGEPERKPYGMTLIQAAAYGSKGYLSLPYAPHTGSQNKEMKGRVSMIVKKPKAAAATCIVLLCAVIVLAGAAFSHTEIKEGSYQAETVQQAKKTNTKKAITKKTSTKKSKSKEKTAWEYHVKSNTGGYFLDITGCSRKGNSYVLKGPSYAEAVIVFTNAEKKRLDSGENVSLSCEGAVCDYTLSKNTKAEMDGSYLLSDGQTPVGLDLVKGQYGDRKGWILSDPYSGMAWLPMLQADGKLSVTADTPVEVYNYYAYYEMFSGLFDADVPGKGPEDAGQQWTMEQYFGQYLKNIKKLAKHGDWKGDVLARVRVTGSGSSLYLTDIYLP